MNDDCMPSSCSLLKDPLSISDLIGGGSKFEINTNFDEGFTNDIFEELNVGSDDEDATESADGEPSKPKVDRATLVSPWTKSFAELKTQMVQINEFLYKRITHLGGEEGPVPLNARICIRYNAYWEGEGAPFDSTFLRGSLVSFYTGRNEMLEGIEAAVRTMHCGEQAQFVISYQLLWRELGVPPRIKPRADALFIIELVSFNAVGDVDADQQVAEEDRNKYAAVIDKIKEIHLKGLDFFGQGQYKNACRAFEKAMDVLNFCRLANEEEQREQSAFLLKLCTNLAVCYIKVNAPARTCIMCKEIRRLTNNKPSCKALFQEGRALFMLGEYERARNLLTRAQRMEPQNEDISKEMKTLEIRFSRYKENERNIWTKAIGLMKPNERNAAETTTGATKLNKTNNTDDNIQPTQFEKEMLEVMQSFKDNLDMVNFKLPPGLTEQEIESVDVLAQQMNLKLSLSPLDNTTYTLNK